MKKEMLINVLQSEECRIAILEDGILEELYVERASNESYVGNIYKGRIVNIEPSIQAAFVDFGVGRNGFLHVSDVEPTYWRHLEKGRNGDSSLDRGGRDRGRERERPPLPPYLQGMDLDDIDVRPIRIDKPLINQVKEMPGDFAAGVELEPRESEAPPTSVSSAPSMAPSSPEEAGTPTPVQTPASAASQGSADSVESKVVREKEETPTRSRKSTTLKAHPETRIEEETDKGRKRSRGTTRRKSPSRAASSEPAGSETKSAEPPAEEAKPAPQPSAEEEAKPRFMESAERRTEKTSGPESAQEATGFGGSIDFDPDLFFPPRPEKVAPPPEPEPEPEREREPAPALMPPVEEVEEFVPPRPRRPVRHTSIEDALEADLAEAEVIEERGERTNLESPPSESEREEEEDLDEFAPSRREIRGDRGDRGDRRDRGDRGRGGRGGRRRPERGRDNGGGRPGVGRPRPLIQDIFKRGQEVIVQVIKEGIGSKGPTLSTYISIPGRYLVLMPCLNRTGVSRKIEDDEQRRRLRQMFNELKPPKGLGFIMRTAAIDKNKREIQRDLVYLCRLWQVVVRRIRKMKSPAEIYQESEMVTRTIRDNFASDIDTIWVDQREAFEAAQEFMQVVMPRYADRIKYYEGREPLFHKFGIEDEIQRIHQKKIPLPNGGSIVIEQTEALVAIDVNSGNFRADNNAEETAYQMNLLAAREIARQLRLRDLGGVIVNDFIDMRDEKHRRGVERALREAMRRDRARTKILKISQFGIIEMTRQRVRPSLKRSGYTDCPYCKGMALVKTPETMAIEIMRLIQLASCKEQIQRVEIGVVADVADYLLNRRRREIVQLEEQGEMTVTIRSLHGVPPEHLMFTCLDRNDNEVRLTGPEPTPVPFRLRR